MYRVLGIIGIGCLCLSLIDCGGGGSSATFTPPATPPATSASQIPRSAVQHLVIVVLQNNSFDHLFGTYPNANGLNAGATSYTQIDQAGSSIQPQLLSNLDPADLNHTRTSYQVAFDSGKMDKYAFENGDMSMDYFDNTSTGTTTNGQTAGVSSLWNYAQQFALADNFFAAAMASEPGNMLYMIAADPGVNADPYGYPQLDACSAALYQENQNIGATITPPLTFQTVGDQLTSAKLSWTWYHEYFSNEQNGTCANYVPQENAFQYFQSTANSANVQNFTSSAFSSVLSSGSLPAVTFITAGPGHSMHPGQGSIANGIQWLNNVVQSVQNSSAWASTAVIVLWDESGGWYDHVSPPQLSSTIGLGARVPVLMISPFAKTNYISHQQMDFVSILRFIQWNWGVGQFSNSTQAAREQQSGDICDLLTSTCGAP